MNDPCQQASYLLCLKVSREQTDLWRGEIRWNETKDKATNAEKEKRKKKKEDNKSS